MKLKDIKTNYTKFHAYLKNEGKNESNYHDSIEYKIIKGKLTMLVNDPQDIPAELLENEVVDFDVEIVLDNQRGITQHSRLYRAQSKLITLWIQ